MNKDLSFGLKSELEVREKLSEFFKLDLQRPDNPYALFDFECGDTLIELKTRRCFLNTYPTTMIGYNKIQYALDHPEKECIFCFRFQDGLYYHRFSPELNYNKQSGGRCDRGRPEFKQYAYIPIEFLGKVHFLSE